MNSITKLSWRDVFDSEKKLHGHIGRARDLAAQAGYTFFCWNGWVYDIDKVQRVGTLEALELVY